MKKKEAIISIIRNWEPSDLVEVWNDYCEESNNMDDYIYDNIDYTYDEIFHSISDAIRSISFGNFSYDDAFLRINREGNVDTFNDCEDGNSPIDINALAEWIIEDGDSLASIDTDELQDLFIDFLLESYPDINADKADDVIDSIIENETFDMITEDWEDLKATFLKRYETNFINK